MRIRESITMLAATLGALALAVSVTAPAAGAAATPRVYNGSPAAVPGWLGFIAIREGNHVGLCDGTAIAPNVVLTADHCVIDETTNSYVDASQMRVVFGQEDPRGAIVNGTANLVPVAKYDSPGGYGVFANGVTQNDVSLLELTQPAPATISVVPMNRPSLWGGGTTGLVLGWGLTRDGDLSSAPNQLLQASMPIDSDSYCRGRVPNFSSVSMLCVGTGSGPSPCQGDSGGPLLVSDGARGLYEAGVVNTGTICQDVGGPSLFARVGGTPLGTWIASASQKLQADASSRGYGPGAAPAPAAPAPAASTPKPASHPAAKPSPGSSVPAGVRAELGHALSSSLGSRFARASRLRTSCRRQSATDYLCAASWYKRPNDYSATVEIFASSQASSAQAWDYTGSFKAVNHRCSAHHSASCRATRFSLAFHSTRR